MSDHISLRQKRLATIMRSTSETIRVADVVKALDIDRIHAAKLLAGWHKQGVVRRIARGLYVPIPPTAIGQVQVLADPWVIVPELYGSGYIGGWSALEYWELTEQLFRSVCVLTNKRVNYGDTIHQGVKFFIKYIPLKHLFGTKIIWKDSVKLRISDPHKTIIDIIDDPKLGAGLQHSIDCLSQYKKLYCEGEESSRLLEYAKKMNNGALFKKLGFLAEMLDFKASFINECANNLTKGNAYLDKKSENQRLVTKWRLWVPKGYEL